jgi:putative ABC transport system permease protein
MFENYLRTTFRNLWKNKGYSFLNIFGLAIGIACAALIFLWVEDELNYNDYYSNKENLYKIKDHQTYDGTTFTFDATPGPLAAGIKNEIPGIKNTARYTFGDELLFSVGDKNINESGNYVDSSFLKMFQLQFIRGNATTAFSQLNSVVISEKMANKFFNTTNVLGKPIKVNKKEDYIITGVIKDLPENVTLKFEWLAPFENYENQNKWLLNWGNNGVATFVETEPKANITTINKKLYNFLDTKGKDLTAKFEIYPMSRWRLYDSWQNGKEVEGRIKYVKLFSLIAWIILIIACINFMNLSTARSEQRAKEVGVRKVLGAGKNKLIFQFIGESLMMAFLSAIFSVVLIFLALPSFNNLVEKHLAMGLHNPFHIGALILIALICGIVAGSYPAFYLSSFNPVKVLKGLKIKTGGSAGFIRKGLVVTQFAISIILIISTLIIFQQIQHVKSRDLGYNKNDLIYTSVQGNLQSHFNVIKNDLKATGAVEDAALSTSPILNLKSNSGSWQWQGKDPSKQILITGEAASPEYISTMGLKLKEGRNFYPDIKSDSTNVIINETLGKMINQKEVIGSVLKQGGPGKFTIIGVMNDFVYNDMYAPVAPLILFADTSNVNILSIRIKSSVPMKDALSKIENVIKKDNPGYPFEYKFVDASFAKQFSTETLIGKLAMIFAILAIFISCLGLFGLAAYTAERRTKEIGIRKVLGASAKGLAGLLSKDFLKLVTISCLIAFPLAWWMMNNWLETYAYRTKIEWMIFLVAGLLALLIALVTVSFQAIKAAIANPVDSLKTE